MSEAVHILMHIRGFPERGSNINFDKRYRSSLHGGVNFQSSYDIEISVLDGNLKYVGSSPDFFVFVQDLV